MKKAFVGIFLCFALLWNMNITAAAGIYNSILPSEVDGIPEEIRTVTEIVGHELNICPELLQAIAYKESRYDPAAVNGIHVGLMQVNVKVHEDRILEMGWTVDDMTDAYKNCYIAADYLCELFEEYEDVGIVLSIYSGNWKALRNYKEYGFLCPYAEEVLDKSYELEETHDKHNINYGG